MIMFGSFLPSLSWLAPPKFTRAWEPTLLWNHYTHDRVLSVIAFHEKAGRSQVVSLSFLFVTRFFSAASKLTTHHLPQEDLDCPLTSHQRGMQAFSSPRRRDPRHNDVLPHLPTFHLSSGFIGYKLLRFL